MTRPGTDAGPAPGAAPAGPADPARPLPGHLTGWLTGRLAGAVPALLRDRPFRRYWCAQTISMFGDQVSAIALPLTGVLVLRAGPAQMGLLTALIWLPYLLFGLHAGAWVDGRGHRRVTMIAADLGRFGLLAVIPVSYALGMLALWQLYAVAFGLGTFGVLFQVSDPALFVALLGPGQYVTGNSLVYGSRAFSFVAGPSLGGILVQALSAPFALLADAISFLGSAFFLARVRPAEPPPDRPGKGALAAGARFMLREPVVRASLASAATINLFNFMFFALFLLYATRALHVRPGVLGLVLGAGAIGGVLGSVAARRIEAAVGVGWAYVIGCVMFPLPLMLVPLAAGPAPLVLGMLFAAEFLSGFGVMVLDISIGAMFAVAIPDRVRSRVTGAFQAVNYGTRPLGSLAGGALGSLIGLRPALWVATAGGVLAAGWLVPSPVPGFRMPAAGIADDGARD